MAYPHPWLTRTQKVLVMLALSAGLAMVVACGGGSRQQIVPSQFAPYPRSEALDLVIKEHVDAGTQSGEKRVLLTTWFLDGDPRVARFASVREDGECRRWQYVHQAEALRPSPRAQLPAETLRLLHQSLAELPPGTQPPLENMIIVSWWNGGVWETRLYDRLNRPSAVSTLFELTNAPIVP